MLVLAFFSAHHRLTQPSLVFSQSDNIAIKPDKEWLSGIASRLAYFPERHTLQPCQWHRALNCGAVHEVYQENDYDDVIDRLNTCHFSGTVAIQIASSSLEKQSFNQLESVRESKTLTIQQYLHTLTNQVELMAIDPSLQKAISNFRFTYEQVAEGDYEVEYTAEDLTKKRQVLKQFYQNEFAPRLNEQDPNHTWGDVTKLVDQLSDTAVILQEACYLK